MKTAIPDSVRWLILIPASLLATAITQVLLFRVFSSMLMPVMAPDISLVVWLTKAITAPFMGAVFVSTFWLIAPNNKNFASITSLFLVAVWAMYLIAGGISGRFIWGILMGAFGFAGAMAAFFVIRHRQVPNLR